MTVVALADEVAAASGLVMGKSARVPAALVRGIESVTAARPAARRTWSDRPTRISSAKGTIEP